MSKTVAVGSRFWLSPVQAMASCFVHLSFLSPKSMVYDRWSLGDPLFFSGLAFFPAFRLLSVVFMLLVFLLSCQAFRSRLQTSLYLKRIVYDDRERCSLKKSMEYVRMRCLMTGTGTTGCFSYGGKVMESVCFLSTNDVNPIQGAHLHFNDHLP